MLTRAFSFRALPWRDALHPAVVTETAPETTPAAPLARALALFLWTLAAPLAATFLAASLAAGRAPTPSLQLARILVFLAATVVLLRLAGRQTLAVPLAAPVAGLVRAAVPVALAVAAVPRLTRGAMPVFAALLAGALVEEIVFRWLLPRRCMGALSRAFPKRRVALVALAAPQVVFALTHLAARMAAPLGPPLPPVELARMAVAGVLLQAVQLAFGLGAAAGAHAAVNYAVMAGSQTPFAYPGPFATLALAAAGLLVLEAARRLSAAENPPHLNHPST